MSFVRKPSKEDNSTQIYEGEMGCILCNSEREPRGMNLASYMLFTRLAKI